MPTKLSDAVMIKLELPVLVNADFEAPATVRDKSRPRCSDPAQTRSPGPREGTVCHTATQGVPPGWPEALPLNRCTVTRNVKPLYSSEATLINMSYL